MTSFIKLNVSVAKTISYDVPLSLKLHSFMFRKYIFLYSEFSTTAHFFL